MVEFPGVSSQFFKPGMLNPGWSNYDAPLELYLTDEWSSALENCCGCSGGSLASSSSVDTKSCAPLICLLWSRLFIRLSLLKVSIRFYVQNRTNLL